MPASTVVWAPRPRSVGNHHYASVMSKTAAIGRQLPLVTSAYRPNSAGRSGIASMAIPGRPPPAAIEHPRQHVSSLVGERDVQARVVAALKPASPAKAFASPKAAGRLTSHVETAPRQDAQAAPKKTHTAGRAAARRDATGFQRRRRWLTAFP